MTNPQLDQCIEACHACANACDRCMLGCLAEPAPGALARCIQLDMDCAAICRLTAAFLARGSEFANTVAGLCAEICDSCADECARHKLAHCKACADACRIAAESCRRTLATTVA